MMNSDYEIKRALVMLDFAAFFPQSIEFPHMFHVIFGIEGEMREGKENR